MIVKNELLCYAVTKLLSDILEDVLLRKDKITRCELTATHDIEWSADQVRDPDAGLNSVYY